MACPVGVQRARQAVFGDHLGEPLEAALRALLLDQESRVDLGRRVVQGHDQIELLIERRDPMVRRAVLMQQHAGQRPPGPLLAMCRAPGRPRDQPGLLQAQLGPGIAQVKTVVPAQLVVEVLGGEAAVALAIEGQHLVHLVERHAPGRRLAEPPIAQALRARRVVALPPAAEAALAHAQDLRGLRLAQPALLPAPVKLLELHLSQSLQHLRPPHPPLPVEDDPTGQIACYKNRSYRVSATSPIPILARFGCIVQSAKSRANLPIQRANAE